MANNLRSKADINYQATISGVSREKLLDFGLCLSWDNKWPTAIRITGKKDTMNRFFETHNCSVLADITEVPVTRNRSMDEY